VEAGRDTPLPLERPGLFSLNLGTTMDDPTALDPTAADPQTMPAPASKPAIASDAAPKAKTRQKK